MFIKYGYQKIVNTYNVFNIDKLDTQGKYIIVFEKDKESKTFWEFNDIKERDNVLIMLRRVLKVREIRCQ